MLLWWERKKKKINHRTQLQSERALIRLQFTYICISISNGGLGKLKRIVQIFSKWGSVERVWRVQYTVVTSLNLDQPLAHQFRIRSAIDKWSFQKIGAIPFELTNATFPSLNSYNTTVVLLVMSYTGLSLFKGQ